MVHFLMPSSHRERILHAAASLIEFSPAQEHITEEEIT